MRFLFAVAFVFSAYLLVGAEPDPTDALRAGFLAELPDLGASSWQFPEPPLATDPPGFVNPVGPLLQNYRDNLIAWGAWKQAPAVHTAGYLTLKASSGLTYQLGVNLYIPPKPWKGTLIVTHGYLSYTLVFSTLLERFARAGYVVATFDLPGNGLSTGVRADIPDFADYGDAVARVLGWLESEAHAPRPWVYTAHSLGGGATVEYLRRRQGPVPDHIVLVAPLLHTQWHYLGVWGAALLGWAVPTLPAIFGFDHFLGGYRMPTRWVLTLARWVDSLEVTKPLSTPVTVILGDKDQVVDSTWNAQFLSRYFTHSTIVFVHGRDHMIMTAGATRDAFAESLLRQVTVPAP